MTTTTTRTGVLSWTADEVEYNGELLQITFDVRAGVTNDTGDNVTPGTGREIDSLTFFPTAVTDADGPWSAVRARCFRNSLTTALDRWYAAEPRYALDDAIYDAAHDAA